jgi:alpha-galactosidase
MSLGAGGRGPGICGAPPRISDSWEGQVKWPDGACCAIGVLDIVDKQVGLEAYAGPGHWNDPDMLEVGNGGMTLTEYRAHFSLWAMLAAPLMAGNDLRNMTPEIRDILTNREAIAVDQDPLGRQGRRVWKDGDLEVWSKELQSGGRAVVLLNRSAKERSIATAWQTIGYSAKQRATVRDLWMHKDLGNFTGKWSAKVPSHGAVMVMVQP